jgi:hypothetical protein
MASAALVIAVLALAGALRGPAGQGPCPVEVADTRVLVERLLTRPAHQPSREETGLVGVSPSTLRRLQDGGDDEACRTLNSAMGSSTGGSGRLRWTYYTAGDRYFVAAQLDAPAGTLQTGYVPVYVFGADFQLLGAYAM